MKNNSIFVWKKRALVRICTDDIRALATEKNYTNIIVAEAECEMVRCTLDNALKKLPADEFIKIHRSYAVAIKFIDQIGRETVKIGTLEFAIGRRYYKPLIKKLAILGGQSPAEKIQD